MNLNLKKILNTKLTWILGFVFTLFLFVSCEKNNEVTPPQAVAYVSLYQASPDAPELDISVDNRQINTYPFDYAENTGYLRFYTGDRNLKFGPYDANNVAIDTTFNFEDNMAYSVFIVDEYPNIEAIKLDDNAPEPATGNAMVRFINLSPDTPALDLISTGDSNPMFTDQSFKESSDFMEVSAKDYDFEVNTSENDNMVLNVPDINIQPGWYYTILVRGYSNPPAGNMHELSAQIVVN